jgi:hypothetical protein
MTDDGGFLVEDFIQAITTQLDRVQDTLRLKALNRPLTYALKDFSLDLNVFVGMDEEGNIRFRSTSPNETGASTVRLEFTTITRPMIEENTVSLTMTKSPTLSELKLAPDEQQRLERLGVRNAAQLHQLRSTAGTGTIVRLARIPAERLRQALQLARPRIGRVEPVRPSRRKTPPKPERPPERKVRADRIHPTIERFRDREIVTKAQPPGSDVIAGSPRPAQPVTKPSPRPAPRSGARVTSPITEEDVVRQPVRKAVPVIRAAPGVERLRLTGQNLIGGQGPPLVHLNDEALRITEADEDEVIVEIPERAQGGSLEIELPDGEVLSYELRFNDDESDDFELDGPYRDDDPWASENGGR